LGVAPRQIAERRRTSRSDAEQPGTCVDRDDVEVSDDRKGKQGCGYAGVLEEHSEKMALQRMNGTVFELWDLFVRFRSLVWTGETERWQKLGDRAVSAT
jgi:hypothetical protein